MWRQAWILLVGLAGVAGVVAACWVVGSWFERLMFPDGGRREIWEVPFVFFSGFVGLVVIGGLLAVAYELGCVIVGCRA